MTPTRTVTITKIEGSITLSVEAKDDGANMNKVQKVRTWEKMKRSDVARAIAVEHGYTPDRIHIDDTEITLEQVTQARMTDAQLLTDMARREGFQSYIDFDGFHFHERRVGQAAKLRFTYFTGDKREFSFGPFKLEDDIAKGGKTGGVVVAAIDPKTKKPIQAVADNVSTKRTALAPVGGLIPGVDSKGSKTDSTLKVTIDKRTGKGVASEVLRQTSAGSVTVPTTAKTPAEAKRVADGIFKEASQGAVKITFDVPVGCPELFGKCVVELAGIKSYSGNYAVTSVKHQGSSGGEYKLQVKARRDGKSTIAGGGTGGGSGGAQDAGTVPTKAPVNATAAPAENAATTKLVTVVSVDPRTGAKTVTFKK
jgi:phage protein D